MHDHERSYGRDPSGGIGELVVGRVSCGDDRDVACRDGTRRGCPAEVASDAATRSKKTAAPAELLKRIQDDQQSWLKRWSTLRLVYRETFLACPGCERLLFPVGTVTHHEIRIERNGRVATHQYDIVDGGKFRRRQALIFLPDKLYRLEYPVEDSRYETPVELNTSHIDPNRPYAGKGGLPLELMWWDADWFPDPVHSPNVEFVGHDTVKLDDRECPRLTYR